MRLQLLLFVVFCGALLAACAEGQPGSESVSAAASLPPAAGAGPAGGASGTLTSEIDAVLAAIKAADQGQLSVSEEDGRFLRMLVAASGSRSILEIGGASGYSGIWLGLGARENGGQVISIEYDEGRAKEAEENIRRAGMADVVTVVQGDAFDRIAPLSRSFDFVFLDAWKPDYEKFFELVFPRLDPGGLFVAHNVVNKKSDMEPFLQTISSHPALFTTIVSPSSEGMSVSYKRR